MYKIKVMMLSKKGSVFCDYDGNFVYITSRKHIVGRASEVFKMLNGEKLMYQYTATENAKVYSRFDQRGRVAL